MTDVVSMDDRQMRLLLASIRDGVHYVCGSSVVTRAFELGYVAGELPQLGLTPSGKDALAHLGLQLFAEAPDLPAQTLRVVPRQRLPQ